MEVVVTGGMYISRTHLLKISKKYVSRLEVWKSLKIINLEILELKIELRIEISVLGLCSFLFNET